MLQILFSITFSEDIRLELHTLFFIREARPYFRQSAALYQNLIGLVSPHSSLTPKFSETELVKGHYEYRHYMQEGFNDDGWGYDTFHFLSMIALIL